MILVSHSFTALSISIDETSGVVFKDVENARNPRYDSPYPNIPFPNKPSAGDPSYRRELEKVWLARKTRYSC